MRPEEMNFAVAERVLGYHVERIRPAWYYGREVLLFYEPNDPWIAYTWDAHSCNAMMYRDGKSEASGTAPPLPGYCQNLSDAMEVVQAMRLTAVADLFFAALRADVDMWEGDEEAVATRICRAALAALEGA